MSPILYILYISDFPSIFSHSGVKIGGEDINYLFFADDAVIFSQNPLVLQLSLDKYCSENSLSLNTNKTKCLPFFYGPRPSVVFNYNNNMLQNVNNFTYLGVVFTTQISASKHVDFILAKCNSRMGQLFFKLPLSSLPLPVALKIFQTYIFPILSYALPAWLHLLNKSSAIKMNSLYTKFLKRWLAIPYASNNAIVHYLTKTNPLCDSLPHTCEKLFSSLIFPSSLSNITIPPSADIFNTTTRPELPDYFYSCPILLQNMLMLLEPKRALFYDILDLHHSHLCKTHTFHSSPIIDECICKVCNEPALRYHRFCCPTYTLLSPCAALKLSLSLS